ncbi:uncharacterized protein [Littorina saxatilis]|uniref:uncharacterized protein n=1 Tax=Littorina saxatilis TaxID=31220 RepID=UPI0038B434F0
MKVFVVVVFLAALAAVSLAVVGRTCIDKGQCAADECCQIVNITVNSKKRLVSQFLQPWKPYTSGTCQRYKQQGASCNSIDVMNGFCGCAIGLTCKTVRVSTSTPTGTVWLWRRGIVAPGYHSICSINLS